MSILMPFNYVGKISYIEFIHFTNYLKIITLYNLLSI